MISKLNKSVFSAVIIFVFVTMCALLYVLKYYENEQDLIEHLRKAQTELSQLKKQHIKLQNSIVTNTQELIEHIKNRNVPTFDYESIRRKILDDIEELRYFINSAVTELKSKFAGNTSILSTVNKIIPSVSEYKRVIVNNMEKLVKRDGFNNWRSSEIAELSNIVQKRLYYLQNPTNCQKAKKLICSINHTCGFGCQMHHLISYMILAYGMQRTLILQSTGWQYHRSGWNDIFMPLSNHCTIINNVSVDEWPGTSDSKAINLPITTAIKPRSEYLPLAIPEDIANRLRTIHGNPSVWWIGQILKYIWRPQNLIKTYINEKMRELKIERPFVGIQIRRTDKLIREAKYHSIEEYMFKVDEYYNITEINNNITKRRVYIATDDINVIKEAKTNYSHYEILYNTNIPKVPKMDHFHSNDNLFDVILDIHILAYSNFLVCTFSSNMCRLVYELMQNDYVDASRMATSIDDVYYYHQQKNNKHRVILKHESQAPGEIDLLPGDIIHIYNNQWNGYSLGTNLRTNQKGLYPNFKVEMEPEIIKFPSYPDIENN